ncbi:putative ribonuclease H-like domain-containing protein [Tanacetum coccineum]|uniref:Ribonuclease H-like domain-containing protein n=1 Tax=Tanacetum coccineum TaxID=301880 RepID=A0ABQ5AMI5_9ASTR
MSWPRMERRVGPCGRQEQTGQHLWIDKCDDGAEQARFDKQARRCDRAVALDMSVGLKYLENYSTEEEYSARGSSNSVTLDNGQGDRDLQYLGVLQISHSSLLYGTIDEEVYVSQPPGFVDPNHPKKVIRRGTIDQTLFINKDKKDIMLVQVFQMISIGEPIFFLGLQVKQKTDGIFISQYKYVADMLKKFDLASVKTAITPMETKMALTKDEEADDVDAHLYRSMIGSLMYLTASRLDIMFAVCACSRFQVTPKTSHLNAVKRIFKYLNGKPNLGLWYPRESPFDLEAYSDSDYAGANLDRKSTTGGCQFLGRRLISWQCKKQTIVATSTTEAEYVAAATCYGQVLWIQNQMLDYGFNFMNTKIHIDNESTICIVKNPVYHSKTKHIEIRHHFIRDSYEKKLIRVEKIHTDFNVADLLTKAFDGPRFNFLVVNIGMINP